MIQYVLLLLYRESPIDEHIFLECCCGPAANDTA